MPYKSYRKRKLPTIKCHYQLNGKRYVKHVQMGRSMSDPSTAATSTYEESERHFRSWDDNNAEEYMDDNFFVHCLRRFDTDFCVDLKQRKSNEFTESILVTDDQVPSRDLHQERKEKTTTAWDLHFDSVLKASTEIEFPPTFICMGCGKEDKAILMCRDCFPHTYMCSTCHFQHHSFNILHKPLFWHDEDHTFKPLVQAEEPVVTGTDHYHCATSYLKSVVVVNNEGFQTRVNFNFCQCEPEIATLVRHSFWPCTPSNPAVAIHFSVMETLRLLVVESQLSIRSFFEALRWKNIDKIQNIMIIKELYRCVTGECFEMYRRYVYTTSHLHHLCPEFDDGTKCPACPTDQDEKTIYSFDANFGLVRRKAAGTSVREPFHSGHFFLDQNKVDEFVENYQAKNTEKGCSEFQAGSELRSKNKNNKLEETGVFGACCRHEYPKAFFNLKHGERLANAVYLLKYLQETDKNMIVLYDIACKLTSHLQKSSNDSILKDVTFGIPVFHCFGHQMACQVLYSPRRIQGAGFTDGETMERLWSFLRRFKKITKEMQSDHRTDLLVDGLMHFSEKLRRKMVPSLCQKLVKAVESEKVFASQLAAIAPNTDSEEIEEWKKSEEEFVTAKKKSHLRRDDKWKENYSLKVYEQFHLRQEEEKVDDDDEAKKEQILNEITKIEKSMATIERRHKFERWSVDSDKYRNVLPSAVASAKEERASQLQVMAYEHMCLKEAIKKYADGQTVASRLNRQLKNINQRIGDAVRAFNNLPRVATPYPLEISSAEVKSLDSNIWTAFKKSCHSKTHRQAVDLFCRLCRAQEEQALVKVELDRVIQHHLSSLVFLDQFQVQSLLGPTSQHLLGSQALIKQHIYSRIGVLRDIIREVGNIIDTSTVESRVNELSVSNETPILFCEDCDSESDECDDEC